jgi:hypothetical protein
MTVCGRLPVVSLWEAKSSSEGGRRSRWLMGSLCMIDGCMNWSKEMVAWGKSAKVKSDTWSATVLVVY